MLIGFLGRSISKLWSGETTFEVVPAISTTPEVVARIVAMVLLDQGAMTVDVQEARVTFATFFLVLEGRNNPLTMLRSGVIDALVFANGIRLRIRFKCRVVMLPLVVAILCAAFVHLAGSVLFFVIGLAVIAFTRAGATDQLEHEIRLALAPERTT